MVECGFNYGLYRTMDSDRKWSAFGSIKDKDYRINTRKKTYFHHCNQYKKKYSDLQIIQTFTNVKIIVLNSITPK
jgi:hypothetical protein